MYWGTFSVAVIWVAFWVNSQPYQMMMTISPDVSKSAARFTQGWTGAGRTFNTESMPMCLLCLVQTTAPIKTIQMKAYRENSSAHWMGLLKRYRAATLAPGARNMRTMRLPDRISSKYFTEHLTMSM